MNMKYGMLSYDLSHKYINIGDHIQSLAAKQYLPKVDALIQRDYLNNLDIKEKTSVIMNGWFTHRPENWPPVDVLNPFFISFHLNSSIAEKVLNQSENVDYLKKHAPIGCRDVGTLEVLQKYGIDAYYSSCLTTTLDVKYKSEEKNNDILIVDLLYKDDLRQNYKPIIKRFIETIRKGRLPKFNNRLKKINSLIPKKILKSAKYLTHRIHNKNYTDSELFEKAESLIKKYANAKLVITSRIHCALPCLALGTPVIFIAGGGLFEESEMSRLKGTIEHLNIISTDKIDLDENITKNLNILDINKLDWNNIENPTSYLAYSEKLKTACREFIKNKQ